MNRIEISGYKSINKLSLKLRPINILIGANGSGKSNFLSFFEFLKQVYNRNLQEFVALRGIDTFLHKGDKETQEIYTHLHFPDSNAYSFTLKKGDTGLIFTREQLWINDKFHDSSSAELDLSTYGHESDLRYLANPVGDYIKGFLEQLTKYHFHDTGRNSPFNKESNVINDGFYLYDTGRNLGAFLHTIQKEKPQVYNLILRTIQSVAPYFLDFIFRIESNGNLKLRWQSKFSSVVYGVNDLSDGTIRFIALATLFLQPTLPKTIIIDEPELGLHPSAISKLAGLIKSAAAKECNVIIATQSTDLISYFEPEDIITVDQKNGESTFKRLDSKSLMDWLDEYSLDDLWKRNIITSGQTNI